MQRIPNLRIFSLIVGVSGLLALLACNIGPITPPGKRWGTGRCGSPPAP